MAWAPVLGRWLPEEQVHGGGHACVNENKFSDMCSMGMVRGACTRRCEQACLPGAAFSYIKSGRGGVCPCA